jgi:glutamate-1-semialdehyde 2,1-aminomutase
MRAVGLDEPLFVQSGEGAYVETADGRRLLDWVMSWGPLIFGHADPETVEAVREAALWGTSFGAATEAEVELAEEIVDAVPSLEKVRLVSSGTEAAMSALRLARAFTKRDRILKTAGGYHGHADALLASAGSGLATLGIPASPGVPTGAAADTIVVPYNDPPTRRRGGLAPRRRAGGDRRRPVAANMGVVRRAGLPRDAAPALRRLRCCSCSTRSARLPRRAAGRRSGTGPSRSHRAGEDRRRQAPACGGGRAEIMDLLAPSGPVYQAGTLAGNRLRPRPASRCCGGSATATSTPTQRWAALLERACSVQSAMRRATALFLADGAVAVPARGGRRRAALFRHLLEQASTSRPPVRALFPRPRTAGRSNARSPR